MKAPAKIRKVTVNLPVALLKDARKVSGKSITETIREGLRRVARENPYEEFRKLWGKYPNFPSYEEIKRMRE